MRLLKLTTMTLLACAVSGHVLAEAAAEAKTEATKSAASTKTVSSSGNQTAKTDTAKEQEITVLTVFGQTEKPRVTKEVRRIDSKQASNCNFSGERSSTEVEDEYFQYFYGRKAKPTNSTSAANINPPTGVAVSTDAPTSNVDGDVGQTVKENFSDNAPFGSAAAGVAIPEGCTKSDLAAAAGRNRILRNDKTLDEAFAAYDAEKYEEALEIFKKSYNKIGYDQAGYMIGEMYLFGLGTKADNKEAINWFSKVADARYTRDQESPFNPAVPEKATSRVKAQIKLARMYMMGAGIEQNAKLARKWYAAASELQYVPAKYILAQMYLAGYGGEKNEKEAIKLLTFCAESGHAGAQYALADWFIAQEGDDAEKKSFEWYQQSAFNPYPDRYKPYAQNALAEMYDQGVGVAKDPQKALAFYRLSAVAGHPGAQNALGHYFYAGELVGKDLAVARKLFESSATQYNKEGMFNYSLMLYKGEGGDADKVKAYVWSVLAGKVGNSKGPILAAKIEPQLSAQQKEEAKKLLGNI